MFAQVHYVRISDYPTHSIREFLLQDEILLDVNALFDRVSLDLGAGCGLAAQLHGLFVHCDGHFVLLRSSQKAEMMPEVDLFVVVNNATVAIRKLLVQDEVLFDGYTLCDSSSFDFRTGSFVPMKVDGLIIHQDGHMRRFRLMVGVFMLSRAIGKFRGHRYLLANLASNC
jgi:hypothetical protein